MCDDHCIHHTRSNECVFRPQYEYSISPNVKSQPPEQAVGVPSRASLSHKLEHIVFLISNDVRLTFFSLRLDLHGVANVHVRRKSVWKADG